MSSQRTAGDGCHLDSDLEGKLHDALVRYDLEHRTHPPLIGFAGIADFKVGDVWIEVWGRDEPDYKARRDEKRRGYHEAGLKLVECFPEDFRSIHAVDAIIQQIRDRLRQRQRRVFSLPKTGRIPSFDAYAAGEKSEIVKAAAARLETVKTEIRATEAKLAQLDGELESYQRQIDEKKGALKEELRRLKSERQRAEAAYAAAHRQSLLGKDEGQQ